MTVHEHQDGNSRAEAAGEVRSRFVVLTRRERVWAGLGTAAVAGLFASLALAQRAGFDVGTLFGPCGFRQRHGLPCPTCGMTTAVLAFARGEVFLAFSTQPAAGLLCLVLTLGGVGALAMAILGKCPRVVADLRVRARPLHVVIGCALVLLAGWAVTFLRERWG